MFNEIFVKFVTQIYQYLKKFSKCLMKYLSIFWQKFTDI